MLRIPIFIGTCLPTCSDPYRSSTTRVNSYFFLSLQPFTSSIYKSNISVSISVTRMLRIPIFSGTCLPTCSDPYRSSTTRVNSYFFQSLQPFTSSIYKSNISISISVTRMLRIPIFIGMCLPTCSDPYRSSTTRVNSYFFLSLQPFTSCIYKSNISISISVTRMLRIPIFIGTCLPTCSDLYRSSTTRVNRPKKIPAETGRDCLSGRPGSNRPPRPWQGRALPNELLPH